MRRMIAALAAVSLIAAPTASVAQSRGDDNRSERGETASGRELPPRNWDKGIVLAILALAVLFALLLILGDDDEAPTSP